MSLESKLKKSSLLKKATFIDFFDGIVGPLSYFAYSSGSENLNDVFIALNIIDVALLKLPFIISYISKTKDYNSLIYWLPKEFVSNYVPIGSLIDIVPAYISRVKHIESKN